MTPNPLLFL